MVHKWTNAHHRLSPSDLVSLPKKTVWPKNKIYVMKKDKNMSHLSWGVGDCVILICDCISEIFKLMMGKKSPKVMAYFLFMQEQRVTVPGWINKANSELQLLCDPLWKRLDKAEKAKYKEMKKSLRQKDRDTRLQSRIPPEVKRFEFEGKQWPISVGQVESPDLVWVTPHHAAPEVHSLLSDLAKLPLEVIIVLEYP